MGRQTKKSQRNKGNTRPTISQPPIRRAVEPEPKIITTEPDAMTPDIGKISSGISKRITFTVSEELHKKAFLLARRQGTTVKDFLTDFLEKQTVNEQV